MRLKRLELQGFKSFLDRTILSFDPGITGVVGPNGCGKSNIVDAIQWVMGEQSAKHLRGDSMTDVIFNGSDTKAPTSMAEVSLVLDRQGVPLSPQFAAFDKADEIQITRRVFRDGTSEYLINKTTCRLKDIHELFMDTGVGKRAYSIIEQGQIDRMISVKPEERRGLFEEVAGITKYKAKRKEAERKLEGTKQNLVRLQDIVLELEKQIRSLKVQATRARKYKELKSELETIDLYLLGRNLFIHKKAIDELSTRRDTLATERSESDAQYGDVDAETTTLEVLRIDQEKQYQELSQKEHQLTLQIEKLEGRLNILDERRKFLVLSCEEGTQEEGRVSIEMEKLTEEVERLSNERTEIASQLDGLETELSQAEDRISELQTTKYQTFQKKETLQNRRMERSRKIVSLQSQIENAEQRLFDLKVSEEGIRAKLAELSSGLESHQQSLSEADTKIEQTLQRIEEAEQAVQLIHTEYQETSRALSQAEEDLYQAREEYQSKLSRLQSLKELQENMEGYSPTARELLQKLGSDGSSATPFGELIQPEAAIEDHLELLLAQVLNTLVVNTTEEAEKISRLVTDGGMERVRVLAVAEAIAESQAVTEIPGCTKALARIRVQPNYERLVERFLGNVFLCPSTEQVFALRQQYPQCTFIAEDSRTIGHDDRALSSGTEQSRVGVFARKREMEELETLCATIETTVQGHAARREGLMQQLEEQEQRRSELKEKLSNIHIERVETRKERERIQQDLNRVERETDSANQNLDRILSQVQVNLADKERCEGDLSVVKAEEARADEELQQVEAEIQTATEALDQFVSSIQERKIERSRLMERVSGLESQVRSSEHTRESLEDRLHSLEEQRRKDEAEVERIAAEAKEVDAEKTATVEGRNTAAVQCNDVKTAFNETCSKLEELRTLRSHLQKRREEVLGELQELELKIAQEQSSFSHLCNLSEERYQKEPTPLDETAAINIAELPLFSENMGAEWDTLSHGDRETLLTEHLKSLRDKIGRYGEVNLTAIQEFDEIQKRYEFLMEQKQDLDKSVGILEEAIKKIEETTKIRFDETFTAVNTKFKEIFPILFNGGKAELALVASLEDPTAGVDILVQPPGKRLQSITLLSGGEKALTAVSLILAIFARKPSPFCLLDEVDAPLDDANVSRFNTVVKKMAEKTQFIVITHNKKTMEIAEALYGVTMERAGISKMTSVRLN